MADVGRTEENLGLSDLSREYDLLISKFPLKKFSESSPQKTSFPDWEISDAEKEWANSYLAVGDNADVLEIFGRSVGYVDTRGLQLLREQSTKKVRSVTEELGKNMTQDSLLNLLRNEFQSDILFYEEGVRESRDLVNKYWTGEGNQLFAADRRRRLSGDAFREINDFGKTQTVKLDATRRWIDVNFNAMSSVADHNENFFRENLDNGLSKKTAELAAKQDAKELVLWSSLKGFVDNLELANK
jgi:hypothetical protein